MRTFGNPVSLVIAVALLVVLVTAWVLGSRSEPGRAGRSGRLLGFLAVGISGVAVLYVALIARMSIAARESEVSFVPVVDTFHAIVGQTTANVTLSGLVGNVVLFVPLGFSLSLIADDLARRVIVVILTAASLSIAVEFVQFILNRGGVAAVDDVLLNVAGAFVGSVAYGWAGRFRKTDPAVPDRDYGQLPRR